MRLLRRVVRLLAGGLKLSRQTGRGSRIFQEIDAEHLADAGQGRGKLTQRPVIAQFVAKYRPEVADEEIERDGVEMSFQGFFAETAERLALLRGLSCATDRTRIGIEAHKGGS